MSISLPHFGPHTFLRRTRGAAAPTWVPTDLSTDLKGWWDMSDATSLFTDAGVTPVSADGNPIYQANDLSGSGKHMIQATEANRPLYKTAIQNGLSIARFDGTNDRLTASIVSTVTDNFCMALVFKPNAATAARVPFANGEGNNGLNGGYGIAQYTNTSKKGFIRTSAAWESSAVNADQVWQIGLLARISGAWGYYINGGTDLSASVTAPNAPQTSTHLGTHDATAASPLFASCDIGEALFFISPDVTDINNAGNYLADKWDFTWSTVS